jgi:hypothetical protein
VRVRHLVAAALVLCGCNGEALTDTVPVQADFAWLSPNTPLAVAVVESGGTVTAHFFNIHSADGPCDVVQRADVDAIAGAMEVTVTFPVGLAAGDHALADVGASAHVHAVDASCATIGDETTTLGTLSLDDDGSLDSVNIRFPIAGELAALGMRPATCASPPPFASASCEALPVCTDTTSVSCWELPP